MQNIPNVIQWLLQFPFRISATFSTLSLIHSFSPYRTAVYYLGLINDAIVSWCDYTLVDWIGIITHQESLLKLQENKCLHHEKKSSCFQNEFNVLFHYHSLWICMMDRDVFVIKWHSLSVVCTRLSEIMSGKASPSSWIRVTSIMLHWGEKRQCVSHFLFWWTMTRSNRFVYF